MNDTILWSPGVSLDAVEKAVILKALQFFKHNKTRTADSLKISVRTLDNKLERYEHEDKIEKEKAQDELRRRTEFLARQRGNPPNNLGIPYNPYDSARSQAQGNVSSAAPGMGLESFEKLAAEQAMPVPKREEVQTVLPAKTALNGSKKGR